MYNIALDIACSRTTMVGIYRLAERASQMHANVMIIGESGVGKEHLAREIHRFNDPEEKGFRVYPCYSSEINFGEIRRFLSSAPKAHNTGRPITVFLKRVDGISDKAQLQLLEVLEEENTNTMLGGVPFRKPRLICSSEKNLGPGQGAKGIRLSLAYRLDVIHIEIPPLRERKQEILPLADMFLQEFKVKYNKKLQGFSPGVRDQLVKHYWLGNVRELRNTVEEAVILAQDTVVREADLHLGILGSENTGAQANQKNCSSN